MADDCHLLRCPCYSTMLCPHDLFFTIFVSAYPDWRRGLTPRCLRLFLLYTMPKGCYPWTSCPSRRRNRSVLRFDGSYSHVSYSEWQRWSSSIQMPEPVFHPGTVQAAGRQPHGAPRKAGQRSVAAGLEEKRR